MDIEAMAKAMFDAFHARFNRVRDWARHNNQDVGPEHGRETFREMARGVAAMLEQPSPVDPPAEVPVAAPMSDEPEQVLNGHD
jgi:hypothetical protein